MNRPRAVLILGAIAACAFCPSVLAEEDARGGTIRGTFVRLVERRVGEHEYLGIELKPLEGKERITLLVPLRRDEQDRWIRHKELAAKARALREGQKVRIAYVAEEGQKWVRGIGTEPGREEAREKEKDGPRREDREREESREPRAADEHGEAQVKELRAQIRRIHARLERMQKEIGELRKEQIRLRRALEENRSSETPRKDKVERRDKREASLPEGLRGFRGMMAGTIVRKGERSFALKVEKVIRVWRGNKAKDPQAAVGKVLEMVIGPDSRLAKRHLQTLKKLKVGDRVVVEPFHFEGDRLTVVEELRKAEARERRE